MNARTPPPRGLRWTDAPSGRLIATALAVVSLVVSLYVGYRYVGLIDCLQSRDTADQTRTAAIAAATDAERIAQANLIATAGTPEAAGAREAVLRAYAHTDKVRAANPAPKVVPCS